MFNFSLDSIAIFLVLFIVGVLAASYAIIYKQDSKSAVSWVGLIILSPGIGALQFEKEQLTLLRNTPLKKEEE